MMSVVLHEVKSLLGRMRLEMGTLMLMMMGRLEWLEVSHPRHLELRLRRFDAELEYHRMIQYNMTAAVSVGSKWYFPNSHLTLPPEIMMDQMRGYLSPFCFSFWMMI